MGSRIVKAGIDQRNFKKEKSGEKSYKGFMPQEQKEAVDKYSRSKNIEHI